MKYRNRDCFSKKIRNQKGFLSADFLFSLIIGITVSMMLFAVCFTFSAIEVAQYMAYATARSYNVGHDDVDKQQEMARNKFEYLMTKTYMGNFFGGDWFELKNLQIKTGLNGDQFSEYTYKENRVPQTGVRLDFVAKIMSFKVSFLGNSSEDADKTFSARVTGLLFREPSSSECRDQMKGQARGRAIIQLDSRYSVLDSAGGSNPKYFGLEDNGC